MNANNKKGGMVMGIRSRNEVNEETIRSFSTYIERFLRIVRVLFFATIIGLIITGYILYTEDRESFVTLLQKLGTTIQFILNFMIQHPLESILYLIHNTVFIGVGYLICKIRN